MHRAGTVPDVTLPAPVAGSRPGSRPGSGPARLSLNYWMVYKTPEILTINIVLCPS